jgi:hypothetical protein
VNPVLVSTELVQGLLIVALAVSPAVVAVVRPRRWSRAGWIAGGVTLVSGLLASWHRGAFLGNYVMHDGAYSAASASGRPVLVGSWWWAALAWLACVSAALLFGTVVERVRSDGWGLGLGFRAEIVLFAGATILGTFMEVGQGRDIYDRYLIPMAIPALALLLSGPAVEAAPSVVQELPSRASRVWGAVRSAALGRIAAVVLAVGMVAGTAGTLLVNAFAFDTAVWHTASRVVAAGKADAQHVDAGLVWDGFHSPGAMYDHPDRAISRDFFGGLRYLPNHFPCYVVSPSPHAPGGWSLVSVEHYKTYGFVGDAALYVFRVGGSQRCS